MKKVTVLGWAAAAVEAAILIVVFLARPTTPTPTPTAISVAAAAAAMETEAAYLRYAAGDRASPTPVITPMPTTTPPTTTTPTPASTLQPPFLAVKDGEGGSIIRIWTVEPPENCPVLREEEGLGGTRNLLVVFERGQVVVYESSYDLAAGKPPLGSLRNDSEKAFRVRIEKNNPDSQATEFTVCFR